MKLDIRRYLSPEGCLPNPHNRTVPLLDVIPIHDDEDTVLIVLPLLRLFHSPLFRHLREVVEAMRQFLQGLAYMHAQCIAHRDAGLWNLMMDARRVVQGGSHFAASWASEDDMSARYRWCDRCSVGPIDYYFIDFGLSAYFPDGPASSWNLWPGRQCPEYDLDRPYNPFKVDVYQLGNAFIEALAPFPATEPYLGRFLREMTETDPEKRPSASEALDKFETLSGHIPTDALSSMELPYDPVSQGDWESDLEYELSSDEEDEPGLRESFKRSLHPR